MNLLTLASVRQTLWEHGPSKVPYATATLTQKAVFDAKLNEVIEHYMTIGKYRHTLRRFNLPIYDGHITLPRHLSHCVGVRGLSGNCTWPMTIYTRFQEFASSAYGFDECGDVVKPISENVQTFRTPVNGFRLRVKGDALEGSMTLMNGQDIEWDDFDDSVTLGIVPGSTGTTTTRRYGSMPMIHKPVTTQQVRLFTVDNAGTELLIAVYAPGETVPAYMRYDVPDYGPHVTMVQALCKMAFVAVVADTDIVYPSSIRALKMGLKAVAREDAEDSTLADDYWARGARFLDREREEHEDGAQPALSVDGSFGFGPLAFTS